MNRRKLITGAIGAAFASVVPWKAKADMYEVHRPRSVHAARQAKESERRNTFADVKAAVEDLNK